MHSQDVQADKAYHKVLVGMGSNVGDRIGTCCAAIKKLKNHPAIRDLEVSPFFETAPVGVTDQPPFVNSAILFRTFQEPLELLRTLKTLEKELGRVYRYRWGPREVDLDILLYEDTVISTEPLIVPHPEMHKRAFVLVPSCELCPTWEHPVLKQTLAQLLSSLSREGVSRYQGPVPCA